MLEAAFLKQQAALRFSFLIRTRGQNFRGTGNLSAQAGRGSIGKNDSCFNKDSKQVFEDKHQGWLKMKLTKKLSVLYAEDDEDSGFMLSTLLGFAGIDISLARTIKEAVESARINHFDLYLLDSRFPDGSGFDLCRLLREVNSKTPVVFYAGDAGLSYKKEGMTAGAIAYLVKPEVDTVASTIFRCVAA
jgi:CheY-like chemotaxis protein